METCLVVARDNSNQYKKDECIKSTWLIVLNVQPIGDFNLYLANAIPLCLSPKVINTSIRFFATTDHGRFI